MIAIAPTAMIASRQSSTISTSTYMTMMSPIEICWRNWMIAMAAALDLRRKGADEVAVAPPGR